MFQVTTEPASQPRSRATSKVGLSEMKLSRSATEVIETGPLGSCVALALYDATAKVGGVMTCMLPDSTVDKANAQANPCLFVDTGVPAMLKAIYELGARRENLIAWVAGAGTPLGREQSFCLGPRNHQALYQALQANGLAVTGEDVGGPTVRNITLSLANGKATATNDGQEVQL